MTVEVPEVEVDYGFDQMDDEAFMQAWDEAGEEFSELKAKITAFSEEHQRRVQQAAITDQFGEMTPEQKQQTMDAIAALPEPQVMEPASVESAEAVGEPGGTQEGTEF